MSKPLNPPRTSSSISPPDAGDGSLDDPFDAARAEPGNEEHWDAVDEVARQEDDPGATEALYAEVLEGSLEPDTLNLVGQRAIEFLEEWYEDTERSILILKKILARNFDNAWALEKLSLLLTLAERWDDLLGTYDAALSHSQPAAAKISLLEEAARIAKDFAGQAQRASAYLKQLLLLKPDDEKLAASLERRLEQQERYQDLVDIWTARLAAVPPAEELALRVRIASTQLDHLRQASASLVSAKELLGTGLGETEACTLLESVSRSNDSDLDTKREALDLLRQRYAKLDRPRDVIDVLNRALDLAPDDESRILNNKRLVTWLLQVGAQEEALAACARWLRLSPGAEDALEQLRALSAATGGYADFAAALVHAAETAPSVRLRVNLILEAAETQQEQSKDSAAASELFSRVLLDPDAGAEGKLRAARKLCGLLTAPEQRGQRLDVLERRSALEPEAEDRVALLAEAAELAEVLGDDERALRLWDGRLALAARDKLALDAKVRVLARIGRFDDLRTTLLMRVESSSDKAERRADLVRVALLDEQELARRGEAIKSWRRVESTIGADTETVDALIRLLGAEQRWDELVELLQRTIAEEADPGRRTSHLTALGRVFAFEQAAPAAAIEAYKAALHLEPTFAAAREGLRYLLDTDTNKHAAAETLAEAFTAADEWENLLALAETRLNAEPNPGARQAILLEAADLLEQRANQPQEALLRVERAFSIHPHAQIEERMLSLAQTTGAWDTVVSGYQKALRHCDELTRTTELLFEQGKTLEVHLKNPEEALTCYVRIVELEPAHVAAACAVVRCAAATGAWPSAAWAMLRGAGARAAVDDALAEEFERAVARQSAWDEALAAMHEALLRSHRPDDAGGLERLGPETSHQVKFLLARWHRDKRQDPLAAESVLAEAVEEHRTVASLEMLCELRRRAPGRPLVGSLMSLAEVGEAKLAALNEAAHVANDVVADPELARPILEQTLTLADEELRLRRTPELEDIATWCIETLVALYTSRNEPKAAFALLERSASFELDKEKILGFKHQAAALAAGALGDSETAARICRQIIERSPARRETINLLAELYEAQQQLPDLLDLRVHELKLKPALDRRLVLRLEVARVLGALNKPYTQQVEQLDLNLEEAPGHEPTLEALAALYTSLGQPQTLYDLFCQQASKLRRLKQGEGAALLYARAGALAEDALAQPESALEAYELATQLAPDVAVLDHLADLNSQRGSHAEAVKWLDQRLQLTPAEDRDARREALVRLASALAESGNAERAISELQAGLAADAEAQSVRELLAKLYEERAEWLELADLLSEGVPYAPDNATRTRYLTSAASIRWRRLDDVAAATPLLEAALRLNPTDRELRLELAEALRLGERFDESKSLLDGLLAEFGRRRTPERATVHFQLAQIARATNELDQALAQLDAASQIQRTDPLILKTLGDVARENGELERAERAYRALLLLVSRGDKDDEATSDIGASSILFELYRIATERDDAERAQELLQSAIEAADEDPVEARRLEKALAHAGKWELLLESLERRSQLITEPSDLVEIARTRADALKALGRFDAAYSLIAELIPQHIGEEAFFRQAAELAELSSNVDVFEATLEATAIAEDTTPALACHLWLHLGHSAEAQGALELAAKRYRNAQLTGKRPKVSFEALARVLERRGDTAGLVEALGELLSTGQKTLSKKEQTELLVRLAVLQLSDPKTVDDGIAHVEAALELSGDYARAFAILVDRAEQTRASERAAQLLERVAARTGDKGDWLTGLRLLCTTPFARLELLEEGATLASESGALEAEVDLLEAAVTLSRAKGAKVPALWAFKRLCAVREARQEFDAAKTLLEQAVKLSDGQARVDFLLQLAALQRQALAAPEEAAATYETIAKDAPGDARAWRPLVELYRELGQTKKLEACLAQAEKHVSDESFAIALRLERIKLMMDGGRVAESEEALRELLEEQPENAAVCELLIQLLDQQDRPDAIKALLEQRLEFATRASLGDLIVTYALQLGALLEDENDITAATDTYRNARAMAPDSRPLLNALLRLVPEGEDHERADLLESLLPTESTEAIEGVAVQLAGLRSALGDETGLERALELGFKLNPRSQTLKGRLHQWYEEREDWLPLAELMTVEASTIDDTEQALLRFQEAALLYEEKLGDAVSAAGVLRQALSRAPTSPQILELYSQYQLTAGGGELAIDAISEALSDETLDPGTRALLHHLRAAVRARSDEHSLDAVEKAVADLDKAASLGGEELDDDLTALLLRQRELAEVAANLASERRVVARLASFLPARGQVGEARELLGHWVRRNPDDPALTREWASLAMEQAHWHDATEAFKLLFELESGDARRVAAIRYAEACEHAGVPLTAREVLDKARKEFPTDGELGERVFRMYDASGAQVELAQLLLEEAENAPDPEHRFTLLTNAGAMLLRTETPNELGVKAYAAALAIHPEDHSAQVGLANSHTRCGQIAEACALLENAIKEHGKRRSPQLSELQHAMANVAEAAGDDEGRFAWLEAALQSDRRNGVVAAELAVFAMERGEYDAAIKALQLVALLKEDSPMSRAEAYLRQGIIAQERGDTKKALLLGKRSLNADAEYEPAVQFLDQLASA